MIVYVVNHLNPYDAMEGPAAESKPSLTEMSLRTVGLTKPARTVAEECIPGDPEKKSITAPVRKETTSNSQAGISTGKSRMNII